MLHERLHVAEAVRRVKKIRKTVLWNASFREQARAYTPAPLPTWVGGGADAQSVALAARRRCPTRAPARAMSTAQNTTERDKEDAEKIGSCRARTVMMR